MINWREKFLAAGAHFIVTLLLAAVAAALIFLLWFPDPFQRMIGGTGLFLLVCGCDLALGPLLSLVIFDSRKSRRHLVYDYLVIGVVQIAALVYGVMIVAGARPAYIAFSTDRFEVVAADELRKEERAVASSPEYRDLPWTGPRLVSVQVPPAERSDAMFQALEGNEEHQRPRYYVPLESQLALIQKRAGTLETLASTKPESVPLVAAALRDIDLPADRLAWLPVHHFRGFWTAIIDRTSGRPVAYIDLDPYVD